MVAAPASVVWVVVSTGGEDSVEQVLTIVNIADFCQNKIKLTGTGYLYLLVLINGNANVLFISVKAVMKGMMTLTLLAQPDMI